jgi:hypothetical protein
MMGNMPWSASSHIHAPFVENLIVVDVVTRNIALNISHFWPSVVSTNQKHRMSEKVAA